MSKMPRGRLAVIATLWLVSALAVVGCGREVGPAVPGSASSPQLGEAGISTVPMPPDPAFVTAVRASCLAEMVTDPSIPLVVHDQRRADLASLYFEGPDEYSMVLVERRADETFACLEGSGGSLPIISGVAVAITDQGPISLEGADGMLIAGHVDPTATDVRIRLANDAELRASVSGGRFVAFWIGPPEIAALAAFDGTGRELARIDDPMQLGGGIP
jgi:hypothetical protein